jgi:hypothetical protein
MHFHVGKDISIVPKTRRGHGMSVEVSTPVLYNTNWRWVIPDVITTLKGCASFAFNDTSALHVHIGIGRPYILRDIRQICKAIVIFEEQMDLIHPKGRRPLPSDESSYFKSCRHNSFLHGKDTTRVLAILDARERISELVYAINPGREGDIDRNYKYNLTSLWSYGTIEFRQAKGTASAGWIVGWIDTVVQFVTMAIQTSDRHFDTMARRGITYGACKSFGIQKPKLKKPVWDPISRDDREFLELYDPDYVPVAGPSSGPAVSGDGHVEGFIVQGIFDVSHEPVVVDEDDLERDCWNCCRQG